jgi:hypothetical protein
MPHNRVAAMAVVGVLIGLPMGMSAQTAAAATNNNRDTRSSPNARITQSNTRTAQHSRSMLTEMTELSQREPTFRTLTSQPAVFAVLNDPNRNSHFIRQPADDPDQLGVLQWRVERVSTPNGNKFNVRLVDSDEPVRTFSSARQAAEHMGLIRGVTFQSSMDPSLP